MEHNLYSTTHEIPIYHQRNHNYVEESERRRLAINITDFPDKLRIKLRDLSEYLFNYTENIDLGDFEVLRVKQCLDINFSEFKDNLVEMLNQFAKREMLLKCHVGDKKCTLVFYQNSKIKAIVYLTLDLHMTDQKEIISEMVSEIHAIQDSNERLHKQLSKSKKLIQNKDSEIHDIEQEKKHMIIKFLESIRKVQSFFEQKQSSIETKLMLAVQNLKGKICKLETQVRILKEENNLKISSGNRLIQTMEKLRLENMDFNHQMQELKMQNSSLNILRCNLEKNLSDLKKSLEDAKIINHNLERRREELEKDLEKISLAVRQKDKQIEEMSKDLVQANTMLVNFNNHYDSKAKQAQELEIDCTTKEKQILDQKVQFNELLRAYQDYERQYNKETFEKIRSDLYTANTKNSEMEEKIRKLNKINALLSQKVNQGGFYNLHH